MSLYTTAFTVMEVQDGPFRPCRGSCNCDEFYAGDMYEIIETSMERYLDSLATFLTEEAQVPPAVVRDLSHRFSLPEFMLPTIDLSNVDLTNFDWETRPSLKRMIRQITYYYWDSRGYDENVHVATRDQLSPLPLCIRQRWWQNMALNMSALEKIESRIQLPLPPPAQLVLPCTVISTVPPTKENDVADQQTHITDFFPKGRAVLPLAVLTGFVCFRTKSKHTYK